MLDEALKVVEAARALRLERKGRVSGSAITDKVFLATAIDNLRAAIEEFDRVTGQGLGTPGYQPRPDFATPPQLDDPGFVEHQHFIDTRVAQPGMVPEPHHIEGEPDLAAPELRSTPTAPSPTFAPGISIPATTAAAGMAYLSTADLGDMELNDGTESVADFLESLDAISDKLEHVVAKVGWTPRLRALAEAANVAKRKMFLDVAHDGYYIRIPAHSWSSLTVALADAVTERDNKMTIPVPNHLPVPKPSRDLEQHYLPRPPGVHY